MDKHDLVCMLKDLAIELGRTPTKHEYITKTKASNYSITQHFGTFSTIVTSAGLDPYREKDVRLTNEIFERPIDTVIKEHVPREIKEKIIYKPTLIIGDTHFPFDSNRTLNEIYKFALHHDL